MQRIAHLCLSLCVLTLAGHAYGAAGPQKNQVFVSGLGGFYGDPSKLDVRKGDEAFGGAIGWAFHDKWSVEAMFFDFATGVEVGGTRATGDMEFWSLNILRKLGGGKSWQPYGVIGGGRGDFDYKGLQPGTEEDMYSAGLGLFTNFSDRLMFRADVRGVYHDDADAFAPLATLGFSIAMGPTGPKAPAGPSDSDGDGVSDASDVCPGTPAGTPVDARGCPRDSDGDGVADGSDRCPDTPAGVTVDKVGCPLDSDGDGVPDHRDACPNTPAGARVDERGCEVVLAKPVSFNLTVAFGFDSAEITGVAFQEMLELLRFLREYPSSTAVIEGHTDSQGAADYNQNLSERRAQAVVQALTNSGIERTRLTARGYGESKPIASNDTDAGRQQNRRVTVVVSGTSKGG